MAARALWHFEHWSMHFQPPGNKLELLSFLNLYYKGKMNANDRKSEKNNIKDAEADKLGYSGEWNVC